jgi:hypothetical protein
MCQPDDVRVIMSLKTFFMVILQVFIFILCVYVNFIRELPEVN